MEFSIWEIEAWIGFTLAASVMQAVRTAGQKHLTLHMDAVGATLVRYLFGLPFVLIYVTSLLKYFDVSFPTLNTEFWLSSIAAGLFQIAGTVCLVYLFSLRNFAVGTTYSKSEVFLTALVALIVFGEIIPIMGWVAITISVVGVLIINAARTKAAGMSSFESYWNKAAAVGLSTGLCMAFSSLFIRKSGLSLGLDNALLSAATTLTAMVTMQAAVLLVYLGIRDRAQIVSIMRNWKPCLFVGLTSVTGSALWFTAFTLQQVSYVKALGLVEMVLVILITTFFFKEHISRKEIAGMALVTLGIILLLTLA